MAALQNVIATTELLECILLNTDIRTLLTSALRVCRSWNELITTSISIQRHLFLLPAPNSTTKIINPLLTEKFPHWFPPIAGGDTFHEFDVRRYEIAREDRTAAFRYGHATWRRMLPRQPPIRSFIRLSLVCRMGHKWHGMETISENCSDRPFDAAIEGDAGSKPDFTELDSLRMEAYYDAVISSGGSDPNWLFIWDSQKGDLMSADFNKYGIDKEDMEMLKISLRRNGLMLLEYDRVECRGNEGRQDRIDELKV